ncbi:MAG: RNA polymerase sigma factor [Phycisphaeraceae bacterium]|nr:MAG: RNA polymerase sigma factor [Phycisphaeraceae bacterium]
MLPHEDTRSDEELVDDYLDGDMGAFRLLIERYHDPLIRYLTRLMGERSAAEDAFQDTFLQIHQSLEHFDSSRRFKPWLFTIATNKGRDALRKRQRRPAVSLSAPISDSRGRAFVDLMEMEMPDISSDMERAELSALVQKAVDELSPRLREILLLAYFQKMSYAQIAEVVGIPLGTVKSRLHAAVAAFAKAWQLQLDAREQAQARAKEGHRATGTEPFSSHGRTTPDDD